MPSEGRAFAFGDVVLVPFPFTNQAASKQRPAVIVSSGTYNLERPDVVMMAVTSQLRPFQVFGEVWLDDWRSAGLLKPSAIKPILATLEQGMIIRRLGALVAEDRERLKSAIGQIIG